MARLSLLRRIKLNYRMARETYPSPYTYVSLHRRARACPSPRIGCIKNRPWPLGCGRFSFWRKDRGGQAPALRSKRRFSVGANTRGGQAPALRHLKPSSHRRARACPSPRIERDRKRPWPPGLRTVLVLAGNRGGQAPALRSKRRFPVGANTRRGQAHALRKKWGFRMNL